MRKKKPQKHINIEHLKDKTLKLPVTYRQLYKFVYRTNFTLILKLSLLLTLFAIPLMIAIYIRGVIVSNISMTAIDASSSLEATKNIMAFQGVYGFILFACFLLFSIGLSGAIYVVKRLLRNEGVILNRDFKKGIKNNWLGTIGLTFVYIGFLTVLNYILNLFSFESDFPYYGVLLVIFVIISILVFMMWTIAIMNRMIYNCSIFMLFKTAFLITFARFPQLLLSLLMTISPLLVAHLIGYAPVVFAILLIYIVIGYGHSVLTIEIFILKMFDDLINIKQFPQAYRQGLFTGDQDEIIDEGFDK